MTTNQEVEARKVSGIVRKVLAASVLAAALIVPAVVVPASAADSVKRGRTIEAFIGTNLVNVQNYPAGKSIRVDVLRGGNLVSTADGRTGTRGANKGFMEWNHAGGGPFPRGDCFKRVTPDIVPGDVIRTKVQGETGTDRAVVRDIFLDTEATVVDEAADTITVSGHVRDLANGEINEAADVLELRLNAEGFTWQSGDRPGRRDLREQLPTAEIGTGGAFEHVFDVTDADAANASSLGFEQAFEWSKAVGEAAPPAIFVSDAPDPEGPVPPGCPPLSSSTP